MKKSTIASKSPAPATKSAVKKLPVAPAPVISAPATAKPAKKIATKAVKPAAPAAPKPTPAKRVVKAVSPVPVRTTVTANIDIGFGNALYLRGEGAGLSWDQGVLMNCVSNDCWALELGESARPVIFKFLVNDLSWSAGEDYTVPAGSSVKIVPTF